MLDPSKLDPTGHTSIDWYMPSLDGSLVAVGLAVGGSEREALTVFDTATGKQVGAAFVAMGFSGGRRSVGPPAGLDTIRAFANRNGHT